MTTSHASVGSAHLWLLLVAGVISETFSSAVGAAKNTKMTARVSLLQTVYHQRRHLSTSLPCTERAPSYIFVVFTRNVSQRSTVLCGWLRYHLKLWRQPGRGRVNLMTAVLEVLR